MSDQKLWKCLTRIVLQKYQMSMRGRSYKLVPWLSNLCCSSSKLFLPCPDNHHHTLPQKEYIIFGFISDIIFDPVIWPKFSEWNWIPSVMAGVWTPPHSKGEALRIYEVYLYPGCENKIPPGPLFYFFP